MVSNLKLFIIANVQFISSNLIIIKKLYIVINVSLKKKTELLQYQAILSYSI